MPDIRSALYVILPIAAYPPGHAFDPAALPLHIESRPGRVIAWVLFCLGGFCLFIEALVVLEAYLAAGADGEDWGRVRVFMRSVIFLLFAAGIHAWLRKDTLDFSATRVRVEPGGLLGSDRRAAPLSEFRGIRAVAGVAMSADSMTSHYCEVQLVHADPALTVSLFEPTDVDGEDGQPAQAGAERRDWKAHAEARARQWSRDLGVTLLKHGA